MKELIRLKDVTIGYDGKAILGPVGLSVGRGEFTGILGPNGGGKSTLLKTILGLVPPVSGSVDREPGIVFGYVPQNGHFDPLFPVSVEEVVSMGRYARVPAGRMLSKADRKCVDRSMEMAGVSRLARRTFRSLSGGEKQRTLIARAVAGEPDALVLDEPTAAVDVRGEAVIMELVESIRKESGAAVIMVSHFLRTAAKYAERIILVDADKGVFREGAKPELMTSGVLADFFGLNPGSDFNVQISGPGGGGA
ncbi:MAG TPA: metal ABC transporter ATP-binding protein [Thermodesulfobacteriota bacterium]|nr:metal ABC transporter ATP-binding protein [Thermodesulfobacteriota bacterium]